MPPVPPKDAIVVLGGLFTGLKAAADFLGGMEDGENPLDSALRVAKKVRKKRNKKKKKRAAKKLAQGRVIDVEGKLVRETED